MLIAACLLALSTVISYAPVFHNEFVRYDDGSYLLLNEQVKRGLTWEGVVWAFTSSHAGYWHPLTWLSHMLDVELFDLHGPSHHAVSLLFHVVNSILLLFLLKRMTGSTWCSMATAALFALHPQRVESVAWAAERKDILSALFFFLSMHAYVSYARRLRLGSYLLVLLCMAMSLMAKPMFVTLPFVLLLFDIWPLRRVAILSRTQAIPLEVIHFQSISIRRAVLEKAPMLLLSAATSVVVYCTQRQSGAMGNLDLSLGDRLANACISYMRYLGKTFWPADLAMFYPYPLSWPALNIALATSALFAITVPCLACARQMPFLAVGWFFFLGTLVPVIGIVQVGLQSMGDRFVYVPQLGILMMVVWSVAYWMNRAPDSRQIKCAVAVAAACICMVLGLLTFRQTRTWRDPETVYRHALASTTDNYAIMNSLGMFLAVEGRDEEALAWYRKAAALRPNEMGIQANLAEALLKSGDINAAMDSYDGVVQRLPDRLDALNNLAWLLATHPESNRRDGHRAVALAQRACELTEFRNAEYLDTLAVALSETGDFDAAIKAAERAISVLRTDQNQLGKVIASHIEQFKLGSPIRITDPMP